MSHVNFFALGGLDENGKNCYVIETENDIFIINAGAKVPINTTYGVDTLIPDFSYLEKNKEKIRGVFITDVKNETFSALPWLVMQIPNLTIYSSPFNRILIMDRLNKYKISPKEYKIEILKKENVFNDVTVRNFMVAGSMPGSVGYDFVTKDGDIIFLCNYVKGDLGIYGQSSYEDIKKITQNREILAVITDAGHSNYSGYAIDKIVLPQMVKDAFLKTPDDARIIVGAYDEEMVAIDQILNLALQTNRPVTAYGKTYAQLLFLLKKIKNDINLPEIIEHKNLNKHPNAVILVTGSIERLYSRFLRIAYNNDILLKLRPTDRVLMIAPPINGIEALAAFALDEVAKISPMITDVTHHEYYSHRPAREDVVDLLKVLKPKYFIPVEGLYRYLIDISNYVSETFAKNEVTPIVLQNGKIAHFLNGKLFSTNGKIKPCGDTIIDGFGVGDISTEVISERELLGREGLVIVSLIFNSRTKEIDSNIKTNYIGVIGRENKAEIDKLIKSVIIQVTQDEQFKGLKDLQERLRKVIRKKIYKIYDKEPMVAITFNAD